MGSATLAQTEKPAIMPCRGSASGGRGVPPGEIFTWGKVPAMRVTEGRASRKGRVACLATSLALVVISLAVFAFLPVLGRPVLWVGVVFAAGLVLRQGSFSVLARFMRYKPAPEPTWEPSFVFLIPSLNELSSLKRTVPALRELSYGGSLRFCYVCEGASTDGSLEYLRERARKDVRIVLIEKHTEPAGRGAAIQYGLEHAPECDVIGFLDADHTLPQSTLRELARVFADEDGPVAVQGVCACAADLASSRLGRLLAVERQWLERVELQATWRLGGFCQFGGGQGFFRRSLLEDPELRVDESMILDDADLSLRLGLKGHRITFNPRVVTQSSEPQRLAEFLDQRYRWARGWVQLSGRHLSSPFRARGIPLALRCDMLRFVLTPFTAGWLFFALAAGLAAPFTSYPAPTWQALTCVLWPFLLGPGPYLAGVRRARRQDAFLVLLGIPLLLHAYCLLVVVSAVDQYVLRRPAGFAKVTKHG